MSEWSCKSYLVKQKAVDKNRTNSVSLSLMLELNLKCLPFPVLDCKWCSDTDSLNCHFFKNMGKKL